MSNSSSISPEIAASLTYQKAHLEDDRTGLLLGTVWTLWSMAAIAVGLRLYAERMMRNKWRWPDTLIVVGLLCTLGKALVTTIGVHHGLGRHIVLASKEDLAIVAKLYFTFNYVYAGAVTAVKASVLVFYYRIFPNRMFRVIVWCTGILVAIWCIVNMAASTFQCTPVDLAWDKSRVGHCIDMRTMLVSLGIVNVFADVFIIFMPLPLIWQLNLPSDRKLGLMGIFALSSIVIVACIARPIWLSFASSYDFTYDGFAVIIWCLVEPSLGIVGACLPLMTPLFRKVKQAGSSIGKSYASGSSTDGENSRISEAQTVVSQGSSSNSWPKGIEVSKTIGFAVSEKAVVPKQEQWSGRNHISSPTSSHFSIPRSSHHLSSPPQTFYHQS